MNNIMKTFAGATIALAVSAAFSGDLAVTGYTDPSGKLVAGGGDTRLTVTSDGTTTTMNLANLYAYGEAGIKRLEPGKRQAWWGSNPEYFRGGTVYVLKLGNDWRGGKTAASVKLDEDNGLVVLAKAPVGDNEVTFTFPSRKAGAAVQYDCQPLNYLLVNKGKRAWLGHPGWATDNSSAGIGPHMVLANNDQRFPSTVVCYDKAGAIVAVTPAMRTDLAKIVQPPADADKPVTAAQAN
jgi:hypothetical protein